jgi:hypothetical protein
MAEVIAVTGRSRRRAYELLRDARTEGEGRYDPAALSGLPGQPPLPTARLVLAACRCLDCDPEPIQARVFSHALVETMLRQQPPADRLPAG